MAARNRYRVTAAEKQRFINALTDQLSLLRAKAGVAQEELSALVGISRQTYSAIERKSRPMSWGTYLSLVLFFDYNKDTHQALRSLDAFPQELVDRFNHEQVSNLLPAVAGADPSFNDILERLDRQALHTINTVIMLEYARCTELPGETVVRSFDGRGFSARNLGRDAAVRQALRQLKEKEHV